MFEQTILTNVDGHIVRGINVASTSAVILFWNLLSIYVLKLSSAV